MSDSPLKDLPIDRPIPKWAVERMVSDTVSTAISVYDATVIKPITKRFDSVDERLEKIETILSKVVGGMWVLGAIGGIAAFAKTLTEIFSKR